jgi:ABC-type microcin C transport system duplicated ATPase subunit YejF
MHLVPRPPGRFDRGKAFFQTDRGPRDLLTYSEREIRTIRGNEIAMIFQEPMTSMNPRWREQYPKLRCSAREEAER